MITYKCPKCGAMLESPSSMIGEKDKCPECGQMCIVPPGRRKSALILVGCAGVAALAICALLLVSYRGSQRKPPSAPTPATGQGPAGMKPDGGPKSEEAIQKEIDSLIESGRFSDAAHAAKALPVSRRLGVDDPRANAHYKILDVMLSQGKVSQGFEIVKLFEVTSFENRSWYVRYVFRKGLLKQQKYCRLTDVKTLPKQYTEKPYIRGRILPVDKKDKDVDGIYADLPENLRATSQNDIGTIVLMGHSYTKVGTYERAGLTGGPAFVAHCTIYLVDVEIPAVIYERTFDGDLPLMRIQTHGRWSDGATGRGPEATIVTFLKALPRRS